VSVKYITAVWSAREIGEQSTLLVLLALADWSNDEGWSWPSIPTLAEKARISDRHVRRILKALEDSKVLTVEHRSGRNHTNRYKLTLPICPVLFRIESAENLTSETEKRTPESVDADIACPINRQEPSVEPSRPSAVADSRHTEVKKFIKRCCEHAKVPFTWSSSEGKILSEWLIGNPDLSAGQVIELVRARFRSKDPPGDRPRIWIGNLGRYATERVNGTATKAQQRQS
jgi:DNA-binding transcriptional regulator YhcF (GntR family)